MGHAKFAALVVVLLDVYVGVRYCMKLLRGQTQPRLATWLIFELGVGMSLVTYFSSARHSLTSAALNLTDAAMVTLIIVAILTARRTASLRFTRNERLCLLLAAFAMLAWGVTRTAWVGFAGFQVVMTVAYAPTLEGLWRRGAGAAPESLEPWALNALAALIGALADAVGPQHDYVAMLYPLRAALLCMAVVALILRWRRPTRRATQAIS